MRTSITILSIVSVLLLSLALATSDDSVYDAFAKCLNDHSDPSHPISATIYTPKNSSFSTVLQTYIRNLRYNETTTPKPFLIITATDLSHIRAAIRCGKTYKLRMTIRSGGHDYEGVSYWADVPFFILDMFNFRKIDVDIKTETAWVQAGATIGEVYFRVSNASRTHAFPAAVCPTVGVGGHLSGGGYGNMMRKFGLSIDNIIDAQIIDVNGRLLDRKAMGEDLFWAITGGGGVSFGVVLAYRINLVRVPEIVTFFRVERTYAQNATGLVYTWQRVADKIDNDLFIRMILDVQNGTKTAKMTNRATFYALFLGNSSRLLSVMAKSFPELGLQNSDLQEMSWAESVVYYYGFPPGTPVDVLLSRTPPVTHLKRKSDYLQEPMSMAAIEALFSKMLQLETPAFTLTFNPYGGRMAEIPESAKPFPHRAGNIAKIQYALNWNANGVPEANYYLNLVKELYEFMTPYVSKNPREAFLNYRDLEIGTNDWGPNSYQQGTVYGFKYFKQNFNRLVRIKTTVDPENFFRNEQSIPLAPNRRR